MKSRTTESRFDRWWWRAWYLYVALALIWLGWCGWLSRPAASWSQGWVGWWTGDQVGNPPLWYFHAQPRPGAEIVSSDGNPALRTGWGSKFDLGHWREKRLEFTWAGWVRVNATGNAWPTNFLLIRTLNATDFAVAIGIESGHPKVHVQHIHEDAPSGRFEFELVSPTKVGLDRWFHLAVSTDGQLQRICIDGVAVAEGVGIVHPQIFLAHLELTSRSSQSAPRTSECVVDQDDLVVFDRAVLPAELASLVSRGRGGWLPELERRTLARKWWNAGAVAAVLGLALMLVLKSVPVARHWITLLGAVSRQPLYRAVRWTIGIGFLGSALLAGVFAVQEHGVDERRFNELVLGFSKDTDNYWDSLTGLLARAKDWISSQSNLNHQAWDTWLLANRFPQAYPGVVGMGYAQQVLPANRAAHEAEWSHRYGFAYRVHPEPTDRRPVVELEANPLLPVVLFETRTLDPSVWLTNHSILGRDLLYQGPDDPRPWAAARRVEEAVARNEVQTSSVEQIAPAGWYGEPVKGLNLYMPLTLRIKSEDPDDPLEPSGWRGLVFASVDVQRMLRERLGPHGSQIGFRMFTGRVNGERQDLLADSAKFLPSSAEPSNPYLRRTVAIPFFYRRLHIDFWTTAAFEAQSLRRRPYIAGAVGVGFSILAAALLFVQLRAREAQGRVLEALRVANSELLLASRERERLSRDLHDGSIQNLYALGLHLQRVQTLLETAPKRARDELTDSLTLLDQSIAELRQFILTAGVDGDQQPSVASALESLFQRLRKTTNVDLELHVDPQSERLDASAGVQVLNVVREAVSNALRHASAQRIEVRLERVVSPGSPNGESEHWRLGVSDDGCGFNLTNTPRPGRGLNNLAARAAELRGQSVIDSKPGQGTRVILEFPC